MTISAFEVNFAFSNFPSCIFQYTDWYSINKQQCIK
jgi:hypothetical protein